MPKGGWLDGALGVMSGLELLRSLAAEGTPPVTVALVDWADEEGARFSRSLFGSAAAVGTLDIDILRGLTDREGNALPDVLAEHGVDIDNLDAARTRMADVKAYVEVHIEQGPVLESMGLGICTVTGTKGIERERLIFTGQASHAGTMPMEMRRDSFRAAARFALEVAEIAKRHDGVTTVGVGACAGPAWSPRPPARRASRSTCATSTPTSLAAMFDESHRRGARPPPRRRAAPSSSSTSSASRRCRSTRHCSTQHAPRCATWRATTSSCPSGALHDASEMAREVPTVMIFSLLDRRPVAHQGGGHARGAPADGRRRVPPHLPCGDATWSPPASCDVPARHLVPGHLAVDAHVAGQAEHTLAEDVAQHFGRAALDRVGPAAQERP